MTRSNRPISKQKYLFNLVACLTWSLVHMYTLHRTYFNHLHSNLLQRLQRVEEKAGPLKVGKTAMDETLEFLWEDEDEDGELGDYTEPFRSSTESFKVRQQRRGLSPFTSARTEERNSSNIETNTSPTHFEIPTVKSLGRRGYNTTLLSLCQYDFKKYKTESRKQSWALRLQILQDFKAFHGHLYVPYRYTVMINDYHVNGTVSSPYTIQIGRWVYQIRKIWREKPYKLSPQQVQELRNVGMELEGVGIGMRPGSFQKHLNMLRIFREKHGHFRVPRIYPENRSLGLWLDRQRTLFRRKLLQKSSTLTDDRMQQLLNVGFDFGIQNHTMIPSEATIHHRRREYRDYQELRHFFDRCWQNMLQRLNVFKQCHGHCNVPFDYHHDRSLGLWVAEQRRELSLLIRDSSSNQKSGLSSLMTALRFRLLSELGFDFSIAQEDSTANLPCPWRDVGKQEFQLETVLLTWSRISDDAKRKCTEVDYCISQNSEDLSLISSLFRRLRWEHLHSDLHMYRLSLRSKWLCKEEYLMKNLINFSHYFDDSHPNTGSFMEKEFDWWDNFFDIVRYKRYHGDFDVHVGGAWHNEKLTKWMQSQLDNFNLLVSGHTDEETPVLSERHFQALLDIGFSFYDSDKVFDIDLETPRLGRKPVIIGLENIALNEVVKSQKTEVYRRGTIRDFVTDHSWLSSFHHIKSHLNTANCSISRLLQDPDIASGLSRPLILWAHHQVDQYHRYINGHKSSMTPKRIKLLESLELSSSEKDHEGWSLMIDTLQQFKRKYGHCFVPPSWHDQRLGRWMHKIRRAYRDTNNPISTRPVTDSSFITWDRIKELIALGVNLDVDDYTWAIQSFEAMFNTRLSELRDFKDKYGHCNVDVDYTSPYFELSLWVREQRTLIKRTTEGKKSVVDLSKINILKDLLL